MIETESPQTMQEVFQEIIRRIVEVAEPEKIILFGSAARGEMKKNSDFDLLVIKRGSFHRGHVTEAIYTLNPKEEEKEKGEVE